MITIIVPAESIGMSVMCWPTKKPSPAGAVRLPGSWIRIRTSRNWFQDHMKYSTPSVVIDGQDRGNRILRRIVRLDAPSTRAASISERSTPAKCVRIQNTPNGMNSPISASITPQYVFVRPTPRRSKYSGMTINSTGSVRPIRNSHVIAVPPAGCSTPSP